MKTVPFPQFAGPDDTPFSAKVENSILMNLYREKVQSRAQTNQLGGTVNDYVLYKTPGLQTQMTTALGRYRGAYELNNFLFTMIGETLLLVDSSLNGATPRASFGPIADDGANVVMASDTDTLLITSGGVLYAINGDALTIPDIPFPALAVASIDSYFVILGPKSQFAFSFTETVSGVTYPAGLYWDPLNFQTVEAEPNLVVAMIKDHNELWFIGNRVSQPFTVGTDPNAPFVPRQDAVMQQGTGAPQSVVALDDGLLWLGQNKQGTRTIIKTAGYNPQKVQTYAVSNRLGQLPVVKDCIGMAFQLNGHEHVWFTFPSADQTLCYDATEDSWYNVGWWNISLGKYERHRANCMVSAFDKILCGDRANGKLYELSPNFLDDDGNPIRWWRRAPHLIKDNKRVSYGRFELVAEVGVGL